MKSKGKNLLEGTIEVDEFFVSGPEQGKTRRGNEDKKQVVMAIQKDGFEIHWYDAKVIESGHSDEMGSFFAERLKQEVVIKAYKRKGYKPLKVQYKSLEQAKSDKEENFKLIHWQIMMFTSWLRDIHHHCHHLQRHLD